MTDEETRAVYSARKEAKIVADILLQHQSAGLDLLGSIQVVGATIVYARDGKTYHLVVHDMTGFVP